MASSSPPDLESLFEHRQGFLTEVWVLFGLGITIFLLRFYVRIRLVGCRGLEGDDYSSILTLITYTADAALVDLVYKYRSNVDVPDRVIYQLSDEQLSRLVLGSQLQLAAWYSYTLLIWSMKANMLFFYNRIIPIGFWQRTALRYLTWFTALSYVAVVLTISLGCQPFSANWQVIPMPSRTCTFKRQNFLVTAVLNVITDAAILCIPIPMVRQLRISMVKKIFVGILLCGGCFVIAAAIIRVVMTLGSSPSSITINQWGVRETIAGIVAINAPILRPGVSRSFWVNGTVTPSPVQTLPKPSPKGSGGGRSPSHLTGFTGWFSSTGSFGTRRTEVVMETMATTLHGEQPLRNGEEESGPGPPREGCEERKGEVARPEAVVMAPGKV